MISTSILVSVLAVIAGAAAGYLTRQIIAKSQEGTAEARINKLLADAKQEAGTITEAARKEAEALRLAARQEEKEKQGVLLDRERRILKREEDLDKKDATLRSQTQELERQGQEVVSRQAQLEELTQKHIIELERVSGLGREEAKSELIKTVEDSYASELHDRLNKLEQFGHEELESRAKGILVTAMQRYASPQTQEVTTSVVTIPSEELKGRIIGKEGRNIKTIERLTGVDIIIDDTPETIVLSSFDAVRRLIAKLALEKLLADGRIQPARIEEAVLQAQEEINEKIKEAGEAALYDSGIVGIDPKLVWLLGRLRFRTSFGQNVLLHSLEVCHIAGMLAAEIGADVNIAKKGGLFHDIGKAVDHEVEGSHVEIGIKLLEKYNIPQGVIDAMKAHHEEYPYETIESRIVQAADAISASRPGARRDTVENYLHRLGELEGVANAFEGVEKAYAIQAGREVRVFVTPESIDDTAARKLARDIANRIQDELKYPGEIKVTLIRETRVVEYAR